MMPRSPRMSKDDVKERLIGILIRFIRWEDVDLSDRDLVETVYARWRKDREDPLVDPNE